jgi:hypothetical protein
LGLKRFAVQVFDYGAPVGYRLAVANPEKITGIISQNGNAYVEGLSDGWNPIQKYWAEPTEENRNNLFALETHVNEIGEEILKFLATLPR